MRVGYPTDSTDMHLTTALGDSFGRESTGRIRRAKRRDR